MSRYLVTAALPYANGPVHIGHLAGCYIPADIYVRYLRLKGEDVKFICGSDEHGVPITIKARKEGITPQQVVDKYHKLMKDAFADFGISFDIYSRTSNKVHHETSSAIFKDLYDKGVFTEETTEQFYDEEAKQFLADRYIVGTCPKCGNENAYGDQCERCGSSLNATDLINPRSTLSGSAPVLRKTKNWFLPLDKYEKPLKERIESKKEEWKVNVYGQCMSWLNEGLKPRAMTRDLDWGVKVPLPGAEGKVLYVWFDAPIGYISATKELLPNDWEKYWKKQKDEKDNAKLIHFIGKDNIVFHCIIFPATLLAHGDYILPDNVPANEFLNLEGDKISTSRNWAVWLHEYLKDFPGREDELRYVLTSIAPETKDSDFSWKDYQARVNNELVSILGNLVNRVVVLTHKYYNGVVPANKKSEEIDIQLLETVKEKTKEIEKLLSGFRFRDAQFEFMNVARAGNKYLTDTEPWKIYKDNPDRVADILYTGLQLSASLAILAQPFMPRFAKNVFDLLGLDYHPSFDSAGNSNLVNAGTQLQPARHLFTPVMEEDITKQIERLHATKADNASEVVVEEKEIPSIKAETSYDDFVKMDLRVATILTAEKVEKADKLLKLTLDTGIDQRTVVSGIAQYYKPEDIIGKQVTLLANLAPRKIKGIESKGMILMASNEKGELCFISPSDKFNEGSTIS
ncbi:MAG: methionine--tRNA ligase [Bacteroidota bacterium]